LIGRGWAEGVGGTWTCTVALGAYTYIDADSSSASPLCLHTCACVTVLPIQIFILQLLRGRLSHSCPTTTPRTTHPSLCLAVSCVAPLTPLRMAPCVSHTAPFHPASLPRSCMQHKPVRVSPSSPSKSSSFSSSGRLSHSCPTTTPRTTHPSLCLAVSCLAPLTPLLMAPCVSHTTPFHPASLPRSCMQHTPVRVSPSSPSKSSSLSSSGGGSAVNSAISASTSFSAVAAAATSASSSAARSAARRSSADSAPAAPPPATVHQQQQHNDDACAVG
jgi:hypothetical protein